MTPQMVEKGRENAKKHGYKNVEFKLGEIESLPIEDGTVDVIISNCVINLAPDKTKVFQEAFRVLKPGGRLMISDLVTEGELPDDVRKSFRAWSECIAGALERNEYLGIIQASGFNNINIITEKVYLEDEMDERLKGKIISVNVSATKPD
jgi:SAM-dependent methyltransferase